MRHWEGAAIAWGANLFLIASGADIHCRFSYCKLIPHKSPFDGQDSPGENRQLWFSAVEFTSKYLSYPGGIDLSIITGGIANARDILIREGLLDDDEKYVKPAKH